MLRFPLKKALQAVLFSILVVIILIYAKPFLVPLTFAAVVSMLLLPLTQWLERKKFPGWLATLVPVIFFLSILFGIVALLAWQVSGMISDLGDIEKQAGEKMAQFQLFLQEKFKIPVKQQSAIAGGKPGGGGSGVTNAVSGLLGGIGGFLTDFILFVVYTFLFILFRSHLKEFALRMFFSSNGEAANTVMSDSRKVAQQYITGLAIMIACLCMMYTIGFTIVGVKNAFLFAMIAAVLETVPFVGNITGTLLTMLMTVAQGGSGMMVMGVFVSYLTVQFLQTYLLEPLVVGARVSINPLITIAGLVAGELIWGIPGMVLTIPLLGIAKIVFDHVPSLQPLGFLMGEVKKQ